MLPLVTAAMLCLGDRPSCVPSSLLQRIVVDYRSKVFTLKMDLREPYHPVVHVPMFDAEGMHFYNPAGKIVLAKGTRVEITGVFNYSERGFFLELARESTGFLQEDLNRRARMRIRFMVQATKDEPEEQAVQANELIAKILDLPILPLTPAEG
ncbi:MAG: hypothetical protein ACE5HU_06925 [Acidobacteriota bacterium]